MAAADQEITSADVEDIRQTLIKFQIKSSASGTTEPDKQKKLTTKALSKCVEDCLGSKYKNGCDIAHSKFAKGKVVDLDNDANVMGLIKEICLETAKVDNKNPRLKHGDEAVKKCEKPVADKLKKGEPKMKETKISKTGGVHKMTDAKNYTGSHKERFDESGKGKGAAGRVEKADTSGYVGNYKGSGTYDKKH